MSTAFFSIHSNIGKSNFLISLGHIAEFLITNHFQRGGVKDVFFLVHQIPNIRHKLCLLSDKFLFLILQKKLVALCNFIPNKVIQRPHGSGRTGKTLFLQNRIELVLFSGQMNFEFQQFLVKFQPLIFNDRILHQILNGKQQFLHFGIFPTIAGDGMIFRKRLLLCDQYILKNLQHGLNIFLYTFILGFLHHFLLDNGNFIRGQMLYPVFQRFSGLFQTKLSFIIGGLYFVYDFQFLSINILKIFSHSFLLKGTFLSAYP